MTKATRKTTAPAAELHAELLLRIERQLRLLQAGAARRFDAPAAVHYGHVGDLEHIAGRLQDLVDSVEKTGEYAA